MNGREEAAGDYTSRDAYSSPTIRVTKTNEMGGECVMYGGRGEVYMGF
jgi:hypothetical protein